MKELSPLIKTNTLDTRTVKIKGENDFSTSFESQKELTEIPGAKKVLDPIIQPNTTNSSKNSELAKNDIRKKANRTQKMSDDVILKIDILKPFLKELEDMDGKVKPTINDIVDLVLDNYIQSKLTTKQLEAYKAMYRLRFEQL